MEEIILATKSELRKEIYSVLQKFDAEKKAKQPPKLYSIADIARLTGKTYPTIRRFVQKGLLKTTKSGLISEKALNEYLQTTEY